ncbi:MAG: heavy-metal-associated domain-containing protein [Leptolinea sp.]
MEKTTIFKVTDMLCSNCAMHLQALEDDLPGVFQVDASYRKQQMLVKFDEAVVTEDQIISAAKKIGYTAEIT